MQQRGSEYHYLQQNYQNHQNQYLNQCSSENLLISTMMGTNQPAILAINKLSSADNNNLMSNDDDDQQDEENDMNSVNLSLE